MRKKKTMQLRFMLLGSGAVRNNPRRAGPSQIVQIGEEVLLFDCGRAASLRLAQAGVAAEKVGRLLLTHLHFDHVSDVPYLVFVGWNNGREQVLEIFGPEGTGDFVERIVRPPFEQDIRSRLGHGKSEFGLDPEVVEVREMGAFLHEESYSISATFTDHAGMPSLAYRVDAGKRRIVITGDGQPRADFVEFCRGADLLVCECSGTAGFLAEQPWGAWHITPPEIAALAAEAEVQRVMIKHLVIEDITGDLEAVGRMGEQIRQGYAGEVLVGEDMLEVVLD